MIWPYLCVFVAVALGGGIYLEYRSHPRDRRSAALRRANEPPLEGEKK